MFLPSIIFVFPIFDSLPKNKELASYVIPLSPPVRQPEICFRWSVQIVKNQHVCFGVDDVIVTNVADPPYELHADFDPPSTADWLSLPGGKIHVLFQTQNFTNYQFKRPLCHQPILFFLVMQSGCKGSKGGALVFNANQRGPNWVSTRDLQLISAGSPISSDQILWRPNFDALLLDKQYIFFNDCSL